jgi:hypothetical protein
MTDEAEPGGIAGLQFDRVATASSTPDGIDKAVAVCSACKSPIDTEYYDINGRPFCARCRAAVEAWAEPPRGAAALGRAALFGFGAAIAGAVVYYAVLAIAHLQIGLIAILSGYMVGRAVRAGARNRGSLRLQLLAAALTYLSVAMAYTPIAIQGFARANQQRLAAAAQRPSAQPVTAPRPRPINPAGFVVALVVSLAFMLALPVLMIVGTLPSGLISGLIIAIGMRQAWRMTAAPVIQVFGPYRVGVHATEPSV